MSRNIFLTPGASMTFLPVYVLILPAVASKPPFSCCLGVLTSILFTVTYPYFSRSSLAFSRD
ncbi:hypothetical protein F4823DRAFT_604377 [Ustulina deusta]|nr:hypothetical protein F4823DRAFT_604377 [Ustulina deusta]